MLIGMQVLLYAGFRYALDVRTWYGDEHMHSDMLLGASALCSSAATSTPALRSWFVGLCAHRYRPTHHDRSAAESAGLSLYGRHTVVSQRCGTVAATDELAPPADPPTPEAEPAEAEPTEWPAGSGSECDASGSASSSTETQS